MKRVVAGQAQTGRLIGALLVAVLALTFIAAVPAPQASAAEPASAPVVRLGDTTIVEGAGGKRSAFLQVSLSRPLDHELMVAVVTHDLTATAPADYKPVTTPKRIKLRAGKTSAFVALSINGDAAAEGNEQFSLELTGTTDTDIVGGAMGTVTIIDDDPAAGGAELGLGSATVFEGSSGKTTAKVPVTLSSPLPHDLTFIVSSSGMSASAPDDFRSARKRVRIAAGKVSASVALSVTADSEWESDEEVLLRIEDVSDPAVSTLAHEQGTVTIRDDDVPPPPGLIYSGVFGNPVVLTGPTAPGSVSISWDEPIGGGPAASYDLELSRDNATWEPLASTSTRQFEHFCGLYFQSCQYRVTPHNAGGEGPTAFLGSVVTQAPAPPGAPSDFTAQLIDPSTPGLVSLSWDPPTDGGAVEVYRVEWRDDTGTWQEIFYGAGLQTLHDCSLPALVCDYRLTAINGGGESADLEAGVIVRSTPGVPNDIVATTTPESRVIDLAWTPPTSDGGMPITGYEVRHTSDTDGSGQPPAGATWTTVSTTETAVTIDPCGGSPAGPASCWLQLRSQNELGFGPWSDGTAVATSVTPAPGSIENPGVSLVGSTALGWARLTWSAPAAGGTPAVYEVEVTRDDGTWILVERTADTQVDHHCGLYLLTCTYRVTPTNVGGVGETTLLGSVTTQAPAAPGAPINFTVSLAGPTALGMVLLDWDAPETGGPVQSYRVEQRDRSDSWQTVFAGADMHTQHTCGVPGIVCDYRVIAVNAGGESPIATASITTQTLPSAPTNFALSAPAGQRVVRLTWSPPASNGGAPIVRYEVRTTSNLQNGLPRWDAVWVTTSTTATTLLKTCGPQTQGLATCRYQVRAVTALGASPWSVGYSVSTIVLEPQGPKP